MLASKGSKRFNQRGGRSLIPLLGSFEGPKAIEALRRIAFGTFGDDELRKEAYFQLYQCGAVDPTSSFKIWLRGEWRELHAVQQELTPEAVQELPAELRGAMREMLSAMKAGQHVRAEEIGRDLLRSAPEAPSVLHNLACTLGAQGKSREEEALLQKIIALDPSYLFAPATLAERRMGQGRLGEARAILQAVVPAAKVHPEAQAVFLRAHVLVAFAEGNLDMAITQLRMLRGLDPDRVKADPLLRAIEDAFESVVRSFELANEKWLASEAKLRRKIVPRGATVDACLKGYSPARIQEIAVRLEVDGATTLRKHRLLASIRAILVKPETVRRLVAGLPEKTQAALRALVEAGGVLGHTEFTQLHGGDGGLSLDLGSIPHKFAENALGQLKETALAFERTVEKVESVVVPLEVLEALR